MPHIPGTESAPGPIEYLRFLRRRWWVILLTATFAVASALMVSSRQARVYSAHADLLIQPRTTASVFSLATGATPTNAKASLDTEIQVLQSQAVRAAVAKALGLSAGPSVSASPVGDTQIIRVQAESPNPKLAAAIANQYVATNIEVRRVNVNEDLQATAAQLEPNIAALQTQIDAATERIGALPAGAPNGPSLTAQQTALVNRQTDLKKTLDAIHVQEQLNTGGARVLKSATVPSRPTRPAPRSVALLALSVGLVAGAGLAFVWEQLDDSVRTQEDLAQTAARELPVYGVIPLLQKNPDDLKPRTLTSPNSMAAESYRALRTSLLSSQVDRPLTTVQVTSPISAEGKTTTVANLGVVLAQGGTSVILIDCDLRRPSLHEMFGLPNDVGFTSVLLGECPLTTALQPIEGQSNLAVLTSGPLPPNPADMLASPRTSAILAAMKAHGAVVLMDCPPLLPVTDASILAGVCETTLLVVAAGISRKKQVNTAVEIALQVDAPLAGIIFNRVPAGSGEGYGYYYGTYQPRVPVRPDGGNGTLGRSERAASGGG